jgi:biopolymer transport protein ExbD
MRLSRNRKREDHFELVVTSMLDINFLLIMFFMMTAQFQKENRAQLQLPPERGEERVQSDEAGLIVNITDRGEIIVAHKTIELNDLRALVQQEIDRQSGSSERLKLMVRCDRKAVSERFNQVVGMLRELGVGTIRIATEMPI